MKPVYLVLCVLLVMAAGVYGQPCPPGSPIPTPQISSSFLPDSSCLHDQSGQPGSGEGRKECLYACELQFATYCTFLHAGSTYTWTVTGGTIVGGQGSNCVTVLWGPMGSGNIAVIETTAVGCVGKDDRCVQIISSPIAAFSSMANVCKNTGVNFLNQSVGAIAYSWNFGDGGTSTLVNPTHAYANAGTYTVTLVAYNKCGCADSVQKTITVSSLQGPVIECPATVCAFAKECYSTPSGCPGAVYNWSVTGGTITGPPNGSSICVQWGAGPQGTISLFITGCGSVCTDTTTVVVPIVSSTATIAGPGTVCAGSSSVYSLPLWPGTYYSWTLSGGTIIAGNNSNAIQVSWPTNPVPANYTINVTWNNILLGCGGSAALIVKVRPDFIMFGPPGPFCVGDITNFSSNANANWSATGGIVVGGNGTTSAQIQWTSAGTQTVTATSLTPPLFCNPTAIQTVTVIAVPPATAITGPDTICAGGTYTYTATASGPGYTFQWSVSGGTILGSPTANPVTVQWSGAGTVSVQQVSTTAPFCASTPISLPVTAVSISSITGPSVVCMDATTSYTAGPANPNIVYAWSIVDGSNNPSSHGSIISGQGTNTISVLWHGPGGPAVVKLQVCSQTLTLPVTINPKPVPTITLSGSVCDPGGSVILTASGGYTSYLWSTAANTQSIVVTASGSYSVTVTDAAGCTGTASITVPHTPPPVASISTPDQIHYCVSPPPTINATLYALQGPGYTYLWSPGGQTTPAITVTSAGSYSVTVTAPSGCSRTSNVITVTLDTCVAGSGSCTTTDTIDFASTLCNPVSFTSLYSAGVSNIGWDFGDPASGGNNTSNLLNPSHSFTQAGYFTVTISGTVTNLTPPPTQCTITRQHAVAIPVVAGFSYVDSCGVVTFTDISTHLPANPILSWSWTFAGGSPPTWSTQTPPPITFATAGPHQVILSVSDGTCTVADTQIVTVAPFPSAAFSLPATACVGTSVSMSASGATNYSWNFGDTATSAVASTSHAWTTAGVYTVTLIVSDNDGCADTATQSITITPPSGPCLITPSTTSPICQGDSVILTASPGGGTYQWRRNGLPVGSNSPTYAAMQTGSYTVIITDPNGCVCTTPPVTVLVNPLPPAVITPSGAPHICGSGILTLTAPPGANYTYFWSDSTTNQSIIVNFVVPGVYTYFVTVTDTSTGCSATSAPFIVNVYPPAAVPTITPSGPTIFCKGGSVTLTSSSAVNNLWNTGATTQSITVSVGGVYSVTVTDTNGCPGTASITVTLAPDPDFSLYPFGCDTLCDTVKIPGPIGPYPGYYTYQWYYNGSPVPAPNGTNDTLTPVGSGTYTLVMTGPGPTFCTDTSGDYHLKLHDCDSSNCKGRICGRKWNDLNGNHKFNYGVETGIPKWKICLVKCNIDGYPTPDTIACTTTDSLGYYCFENLCAGDYCVVEEQRAGWTQTWPANPPFYHVTITDSGSVVGLDFGNKFKCIKIWITADTVGVPNVDVLPFGFEPPPLSPWPIVVSYRETPVESFTEVFSGIVTENVSPIPWCKPGWYSIRRKHVANFAFDRVFINDSLRGDGSTDSVLVHLSDSTGGASILFLDVPAPDTLKRFRTFTAAQLALADQGKPVKRTKPGKPIVMPNTANVIDEMLKQGAVVIAGLPGQLIGGKTIRGYLHPAKQADVFKTFNVKGSTHTGSPRGLDQDIKGKLIVKRQKSVPATKHNNRFLANLLALKINIAASELGKTPPGFGDLVYVSPSGPSPWFVDGQEYTVAMIASKADSILTNWSGISYQEYNDINAIMESLNAAFSGSVPFGPGDTLKWIVDGKLALSGAVALVDIPFLLEESGSSALAAPAPRPVVNEEPDVFSLEQNYPNPFNPSTSIQFTLAAPAVVSLKIYDVLGREVGSLLSKEFVEEGSYQYEFDASGLPSGVYFYHLVAESVPDGEGEAPFVFRSVRKMLLLK